MRRKWLYSLVGTLLLSSLAPVRAQVDPDDSKRGVARISLVNGEVSVQRGDSGEWVAASVNAPVVTNDRISTGPNSRAEVEFDSGTALRIGGEAVVTVSELEYGRYQMAVGRGTVTLRLLRPSGADIEVDTPSVSVRPTKQGAYRIAVPDSGESQITARGGDVEVFGPRGTQWVAAGQMMLARGNSSDPEFQLVAAPPPDDWDRWNDGRDRPVMASPSYQNVPPGVYGAEDLDAYGSWTNVPEYGEVWRPTVAAGWAPYRYGRWVWMDWYGWTWVSNDPWGWAPYHYGRWFFEPAYGWCWYPGAIGIRHYWSPALVAFFGFGGGGVGFGFGNVGWVPLAPYEVLHPWWGRGFYGRPEYFNRSINITNVNITNVYRNARITNGFTAVRGEDFRGGRFGNFVRPSGEDLRQASFARGPIPVAPERANLRYTDRQSAFVPRSTGSNRVFSYRQPTPAERVPFGSTAGRSPSFGAPGSRFGAPSAQSGIPQNGGPGGRNEAGGWQRFGERTAPAAPRTAPVSPRTEQGAPPAATRGWGRFGEPNVAPRQDFQNQARPAAPRFESSPNNRPESLRIAPPVVRERPFAGGGYGAPTAPSAPRNEARPSFGGGYNAPSAPRNESRPSFGGRFSAPSAPRNESRPSFGGGFGGPRNESPRGSFSAPRAPSGGGGGGGGNRGSHGGGGNGGGGHHGR